MPMGTRATVQFRDPNGELSCIVYGLGADRVVNLAGQYAAELTRRNETEEPEGVMPLDRFEASAVIGFQDPKTPRRLNRDTPGGVRLLWELYTKVNREDGWGTESLPNSHTMPS